MKIAMFYHSLVSDWNHRNAHFLRGIVSELLSRGHEVEVYEPANGWSLRNLLDEHGVEPIRRFTQSYGLSSNLYDPATLDLDEALDGADLAVVHEWNDHDLVKRIGAHRNGMKSYRLLFHDTHHRCVTDPEAIGAYDLRHYDGVLACGRVIRDIYLEKSWARKAWTWHEAADTRVFHPLCLAESEKAGQVVWIGNWGDEERTAELREFFIEPVRELKLKAQAYGVRYPEYALAALAEAAIDYRGWIANYHVPEVFARFRVTVHIPRRPYVDLLPGIPTIRPFEALACGIPLVCSRWEDVEGLFYPGRDYLVARSGREMKCHLEAVLHDPGLASDLASSGLRTILSRHTCSHRVEELLRIYNELEKEPNDREKGPHVRRP